LRLFQKGKLKESISLSAQGKALILRHINSDEVMSLMFQKFCR